MDPASTLGLSTESIHGYSISHVKRVLDSEPPELPPCRRGVNNISVSLKGRSLSLGVQWFVVKGRGGSSADSHVCIQQQLRKLQPEARPCLPGWKILF